MKKLIAIVLCTLMLAASTACVKGMSPDLEQTILEDVRSNLADILPEGWQVAEDFEVTDEMRALFDKVFGDMLDDTGHLPVAYLGSLIDEGTSYCFLELLSIMPDAKIIYRLTFLHENSDGTVEKQKVMDLPFGQNEAEENEIGNEVGVYPFFPQELMWTDGEWIYFASAKTKMLYLFKADGANTKLVSKMPVELPFEERSVDAVDFMSMRVLNGYLFLVVTCEHNRNDPNYKENEEKYTWPDTTYLEVYSLENHNGFRHVASLEQSGSFFGPGSATMCPSVGRLPLIIEGSSLIFATEVGYGSDFDLSIEEALKNNPFFSVNGNKTLIGEKEIELNSTPDPELPADTYPLNRMVIVTAINTEDISNITLRRAVLGNQKELDAWLGQLYAQGATGMVGFDSNMKENEIEDYGLVRSWKLIPTDYTGSTSEYVNVYYVAELDIPHVLVDQDVPFIGGSDMIPSDWSGYRVGDLLILQSNCYTNYLLIASAETLEPVTIVPFN